MEDYYAHIDDYVNGLLDDGQKAQFEAAMESDASLKNAVENYGSAKDISEGLLEVDMMETLDRLKKSYSDKTQHNSSSGAHESEREVVPIHTKKGRNGIFRRQWLAAAVVIGLVALTAWWMMSTNGEGLDKEIILANYIRPYDEDATKSIEDVETDPFKRGKQLFALNRFEESIPFFEQYVSEVSEKKLRSEGYFWLGAAYLETWQVEKARVAWEKSEVEDAKRNLEMIGK